MKTYNKTVSMPRLQIEHDGDAESPRAWDNLGFFYTKESHYKSPDGNTSELYRAMVETADEATSTENHIELMKARAKESGEEIVAIYPVYRYEHSAVAYRRGTMRDWDASNCGFYIVTKASRKLHSGQTGKPDKRVMEKIIDAELAEYTQWCNGEVYAFTLYDAKGNVEESCGGFYDIEHIRENLPDEWKKEDLRAYLTN